MRSNQAVHLKCHANRKCSVACVYNCDRQKHFWSISGIAKRLYFVKFGEGTTYSWILHLPFVLWSHRILLNWNVPAELCAVQRTSCLYLATTLRAYSPFYASSPFCLLRVALVSSSCIALSVTYVLNNYMCCWNCQTPYFKSLNKCRPATLLSFENLVCTLPVLLIGLTL